MSSRRPAITGPAAPSLDLEQRVRQALLADVEKAEAELEAARDRGERPDTVRGFYEYRLRLSRAELHLFDRGEGSWRETYRLPTAPGARADIDHDAVWRETFA